MTGGTDHWSRSGRRRLRASRPGSRFRPWPRPTQTSSPRSFRRRAERLRALPAHRRAARAAEGRRRVGAPRRAALPDGPPVVGALAEARRGSRSEEATRADRGARPRRRDCGCCAARTPRSHYVDGFLEHLEQMSPWEYQEVRRVLGHGSRLRLARLPRDPPGLAAARTARSTALRRERGLSLARGVHARAASTRTSTSSPSC